ncbi:MAG: YceI family protein [Gammaproteobacteria bacterium]|nr:YceI family protein [Gammaproteobacteria bacterium]
MKKFALSLATLLSLSFASTAAVADDHAYKIDKGHTFITFEISHIGFAFLPGSFNEFDGELVYDAANPADASTRFTIQVESIDTEHAERDKHLRGEDFFDVAEYPTATFVSTAYEPTGDNTAKLTGDLTLKGVTRSIVLDVVMKNAAKDPWGNDRIAFEATGEVTLADFNIDYDLGPASRTADIKIAVEAIK